MYLGYNLLPKGQYQSMLLFTMNTSTQWLRLLLVVSTIKAFILYSCLYKLSIAFIFMPIFSRVISGYRPNHRVISDFTLQIPLMYGFTGK